MPTGRTRKAYLALAAYLPNLPDASCRDHPDPDLWHPERTSLPQEQEAIAICNTCPAQQSCLLFAQLAHPIPGIWGGTTMLTRSLLFSQARSKVSV